MNDLRNILRYILCCMVGFQKQLYILQSTLSRNVSKFEKQLNKNLIIRLQNGI